LQTNIQKQSNNKFGASENNLQIYSEENREQLLNNYYFENNSEKYDSISNKNLSSLKKLSKINLNFLSKRK